MPSDTTTLLRSIRRWLIVIAFALGIGIVALAGAGYEISGHEGSLVSAVAGVSGGTVALVAGLAFLGSFVPE